VYEGGASDSLYTVFNRIVSDDSAKIVSASWTNGCEAYVGQSLQNSENTLFQAAAAEGQSIFVASGDEGAQGCNINGEIRRHDRLQPGGAGGRPFDGTLYIANKSSNTLSVGQRGDDGRPDELRHGRLGVPPARAPAPTPSHSTQRAARSSVANANSTMTVVSSAPATRRRRRVAVRRRPSPRVGT